MTNLVADAPRSGKQTIRLTEPTLTLRSPAAHFAKASARFACARCLTRLPPKAFGVVETVKSIVRARKERQPDGRETSSGQNRNSSRVFARGQHNSNIREHGQLPVAPLIFRSAVRNWPSSLERPNWSDTSPPDFALDWLIAPMHPSRRRPGAPFCRRRVGKWQVALPPASRWRDSPGKRGGQG